MKSRRKNKKLRTNPIGGFGLVTFSILFALLAIEGVSWIFVLNGIYFGASAPPSPFALRSNKSLLDRSALFYPIQLTSEGIVVPKKETAYRGFLQTTAGEPIYDVIYTVDKYRRRIVPGQNGNRKKHVLLLGCSLTFGEGNNDAETIPYYFSLMAKHYHTYNFGFHGYGINDLLARARLEKEKYWEGVEEEEGIAIYVFTQDHIGRFLGSMAAINGNLGPHPYFKRSDDGSWVNLGEFSSARPWLTGFYRFVGQTNFVKAFSIDLPLFQEREWKAFAEMVGEMEKEYLARFPKGKFVVFALPQIWESSIEPLPTYLKEMRISYIDYSKFRLEELVAGQTYWNPDSHFTPRANAAIAQFLSQELRKLR